MEVSFRDKKFKKIFEDGSLLKRRYGSIQAELIVQRINELFSAESLFDLSKLPQVDLHLLKGNLRKCYALNIKQPYRIIITYLNGESRDLKSINKVMIIGITNYH